MTFHPFSLSPNIFTKLCISCLILCSGCASVNEFFFPSATDKQGFDSSREAKRKQKVLSGQFEWAVQNYEAGNYKEAIEQLKRLELEGPTLPNFDLVKFYLGMSQSKVGAFNDATANLEAFLRVNSKRPLLQDARISLLLIYERQEAWDKLLGLAAETEKTTLFQENRALLKLLWSQALIEKDEIKGARSVLNEATDYMVQTGRENSSFHSDPNRDLWGRYYYLQVTLQQVSCAKLSPQKSGKSHLFKPWIETVTDCSQRSLAIASEELYRRESPWAAKAGNLIGEGMRKFGGRIKDYLKKESSHLARQRALEQTARQNLYRFLNTLDKKLKIFKEQGISAPNLESTRKQLDHLLTSL